IRRQSTETALGALTLVERNGHPPQDSNQPVKRHKTSMKNKYESLFEGIKTQENKTLLNRIYTQLYIIEGESEGVNEEHEVLQMERTPRRHLQDTLIHCLDIFKPLQGSKPDPEEENTRTVTAKGGRQNSGKELKGQKIRSVLTKGIAGIGKTVSVQKFILDWAEGKANQDVELMFVLPFRELNLIKNDPYSLHGLLCDFHPELKDLDPKIYDQIKVVFIFDGLDESRIPLDFEECEKVSDITMTSSVGVLMTNLIKGELLPSALIWITSRPAAANQIPPKHINRVTEIQGFSDPQKEEYFRKRISDEDQAKRIISHIKTVRSLHIMCHIPVFCWISATVLQQIMKQGSTEIPRTLTEMYSHFLLTQTHMKNEKYEEKDERDPKNLLVSNRTILLKLAELAFKQLMKGNVMFYEKDLRESRIDVPDASVYSGIFTEIFREECVLYQRKVYCFVHLSFQEFLAAVYVIHCYQIRNMKELQIFNPWYREWSDTVPLHDLLMGAVYKAVESPNGHLDLFLRFLLGISQKSNQRLLQGLLMPTQSSLEKIAEYIKALIRGDKENQYYIPVNRSLSTERSINLFLCLSEMNEQSLSRELQEYLKSETHSEKKLSPGQCSALACMFLISKDVLPELDLKKYSTSVEGYRRLIPAVTVCKKAILSGCMVTNAGCFSLASALKLNPSHLRELDLTYNYPGEYGMKLLSDLLEDPHCNLKKLQMEHGGKIRMKQGLKKYACELTLDPNTAHPHLYLMGSERKKGVTSVEEVKPVVCLLSDWSMGQPPVFSSGGGEPSCVSMKSDWSMGQPPVFSSGGGEPSCMSMKSDWSMGQPPVFSSGGGEPSCVSMKSDWSMGQPPVFSRRGVNCVSIRQPLGLNSKPMSFNSEQCSTESELITKCLVEKNGDQPVNDVLQRVLEKHKTSMKNKYESLFEGIKTQENKTLLNRIYTQLYIIEGESEGVNEEHEVLQMERTPRRHLQDTPINCLDIFKPLKGVKGEQDKEKPQAMSAKGIRHTVRKEGDKPKVPKLRSVLTKGIAGIGKTVSVQKFILDWAEGKANQDVELMFVLPFRELNLIKDDPYSLHGLLCDFHPELKALDPKIYDQIKVVFIFDGLDESRIPLDFKESEKVCDITMTSSVGVLMTNLIKGELLPSALIWITSRPAAANQIPPKHINHVTEIQGFSDPQKEEYFRKRISDEDQAKRIISHIKTVRSLHIMCHIPVFCWISATVLQQIMKQGSTEIPRTLTEMYSHFLLTQTNMKNEKYEEKVERDPKNLLESNRTILLKLAELAFKQLMKGNMMFYEEDLRESSIDVTDASLYSGILTEIFREECVLYQRKVYCFVHLSFQEFLAAVYVFHCYECKIMKPLQYFNPWNKAWSEDVELDELLKGSLHKALESQNGHLDLFLRFLMGISLQSNQRLLPGLLIHMQNNPEKIKEYIKNVIKTKANIKDHISTERSINLFLCLSEMNDQSLFREIQKYLKSEKLWEMDLSPEQCSVLAYILLNTEEVMDELNLKRYRTSEEGYRRLIPAVAICRKALLSDCNLFDTFETACFALQSVNCPVKELDLSNNSVHDSGVEQLNAGLRNLHGKLEILRLVNCALSNKACEILSSILQSENSSLKELDISNNDVQDSGVELLSAGLRCSHCKLEILRLVNCSLREKACEIFSSILKSANFSLKELDISNNDIQDSGMELLCTGLKGSCCKQTILRLAGCNLGRKACEILSFILQSANFSLKGLDLTKNDLQDSGVKLLSAGLKSSHCKLEILRLSGCMVTEDGCYSLASALKCNPSHLRELDLTYNHPGEPGVKLLSNLLDDPHCTLEKLQVDHGGEIRMKPGLKKYTVDLSLDPNTVNSDVSLSERNRKLVNVGEYRFCPDYPDRVDACKPVLSAESLTGRCYWEVQWSGDADITVSYRGISSEEDSDVCLFGNNSQYWGLQCSDIGYAVEHNNLVLFLPEPPSPSNRVGVYLDWECGTLSFYTISPDSHTRTHLHTFTTTFTEPVYVEFYVFYNSSVSLCEIE
ncbi:hypothetical protein NFI96_017567, partial [Prochilodus magdalenae]